MITRSHVEADLRLLARRRYLLAVAGLLVATLACSRGDVPAPGGIGSGGLPGLASATSTRSVSSASATSAAPQSTATASATPTPLAPPATPTFPPTPTLSEGEGPETILYETLPGDSLRAVAVRFGVVPTDITSPDQLPDEDSLIDPRTLLIIPRRLGSTGPATRLLPDSEIVFAPHAADFDVLAFAADQGGYLNQYNEYVSGRQRTGPEIVALVARDNSINPRALLALLEYRSAWMTDRSRPQGDALRYPMGKVDPAYPGLFRQLTWLANEIGIGYYSWRAGSLTDITFSDGTMIRLAPDLNAGTVALQYFFSLQGSREEWERALGPGGFMTTYQRFFGDPWATDYAIFSPGVRQPALTLPFPVGHTWAFTGGPHGAWEREAAWAALDFAPSTAETGCGVSDDWAVAAAPGLVVRSEDGVVALDLDGDGREQTGWVLIYLHVAAEGRVPAGSFVEEGDDLGHPSCEGGTATGSHIHLVRKYNGEWILADGPLPFDLGGWTAHAGSKPYEGWLDNGGQVVVACPCGSQETHIRR